MQLQTDNLGKVAITIEEGFWDVNKDYEKLTVVQVRDSYATYVSRKPVPAGTELTNRNYWIPFSSLKEDIVVDYNKFLSLYGVRLSDFELKIKTMEQDLIDLRKYVQDAIRLVVETNTKSNETLVKANEAICRAAEVLRLAESIINTLGFKQVSDDFNINAEVLYINVIDEDKLLSLLN